MRACRNARRVNHMIATEPADLRPEYDGGVVTTRGSYRIGPFNGVYPSLGVVPREYRTDGVPGCDDDREPSEIALFVHGFLLSEPQASTSFDIVRNTLRQNGYDHPLVGFTWDSDRVTAIDDWYPTVAIAALNGKRLAAFLTGYRRENPGTEVRLVGHSLGARVVLSALESLADSNSETVENVALLGAAVDDETPGRWVGRYGDAVANGADSVTNYHSRNDDRLLSYTVAQWDVPLGRRGADGRPPANYTDRDVSFVESHLAYYREGVGCLDLAVRNWDSAVK